LPSTSIPTKHPEADSQEHAEKTATPRAQQTKCQRALQITPIHRRKPQSHTRQQSYRQDTKKKNIITYDNPNRTRLDNLTDKTCRGKQQSACMQTTTKCSVKCSEPLNTLAVNKHAKKHPDANSQIHAKSNSSNTPRAANKTPTCIADNTDTGTNNNRTRDNNHIDKTTMIQAAQNK